MNACGELEYTGCCHRDYGVRACEAVQFRIQVVALSMSLQPPIMGVTDSALRTVEAAGLLETSAHLQDTTRRHRHANRRYYDRLDGVCANELM